MQLSRLLLRDCKRALLRCVRVIEMLVEGRLRVELTDIISQII